MTAEEILRLARQKLDDTEEPFLWDDIELLDALNRSINEIATKAHYLRDASTTAACQIKLLSNLGLYSLDSRVTTISSAQIEGQTVPLTKTTEDWMDRHISNWKEQIGEVPTYIVTLKEFSSVPKVQFVPKIYIDSSGEVSGTMTFSLAAKTITLAGGSFTSHYAVDDEINVDGTASNDGFYTIHSLTDTEITVHETLANESGIATTIRKVEGTCNLSVLRTPTTEILLSDLTVVPEMPPHWHRLLVDGILACAYDKDDADTYDVGKGTRALAKWARNIEDIKREVIRRKHTVGALEPHPGTI